MKGSIDNFTTEEPFGFQTYTECAEFTVPSSKNRVWYMEKCKVDSQERTRRCHAKKANLQNVVESNVDPRILSCTQKIIIHRTSARLAREISKYAAQKLKNQDTEVQYFTITKLLGQPMLKGIVPPFVRDQRAVKLGHEVLNSFKDDMQAHLMELRKAKSLLAKTLSLYLLLHQELRVKGVW